MAELRPKFHPNDEEGLLQMQKEFLAGRIPKSVIDVKSTPSSYAESSHRKKSMFAQRRERDNKYAEVIKEKPSTFEFPQIKVVGDVVEKSVSLSPSNKRGFIPNLEMSDTSPELSFPPVFLRDKSLQNQDKESLFAQEIKKSKLVKEIRREPVAGDSPNLGENCPSERISPSEVETIKVEIHKENILKLSAMAKEEILQEQKSIAATLDPKLLSFLKNRHAAPTKQAVETNVCSTSTAEEMELDDTTVELKKSEYVNMNVVEKEKLEHWLSPLPSVKGRSTEYCQARFDFEGCLLPEDFEVPTTESALYHHGEEPERAGYSINELIILSNIFDHS